MKKISELFKDIVRCIAIGITISAIISIAISIMCVFMYKGNIVNIVCEIKTVLICIGAFGMILVAILLMKKKKEKPGRCCRRCICIIAGIRNRCPGNTRN